MGDVRFSPGQAPWRRTAVWSRARCWGAGPAAGGCYRGLFMMRS